MDSYHCRRILYHLSLSVCLLLAGWPSLPVSAGTLKGIEHSQGQVDEQYRARLPILAQPTAVEKLYFAAIAAGMNHTCGLTSGGAW